MVEVKVKLKELLKERNITQKELALLTGLREATISDIARGSRTGVNLAHLSIIAEALNVKEIQEILQIEEY